jgi:SAM-dependent methyltransferase
VIEIDLETSPLAFGALRSKNGATLIGGRIVLRISRVILPFVPDPLRGPAKQARNFFRYQFGLLSYQFGISIKRRDPFVPPAALHPVGAGDYRTVGEEFFGYFTTLAGLRPKDRVLDIGCGTGRMALPLTRYLDGGTYDGFDIAKPAINWCRRIYGRRYPHFHFHHADLHNDFYNRRGRQRAEHFLLPFQKETFDFVFLTSVFTHMLPDAIENYLAEITRVLKPHGRCLTTFFLITPESLQLMKSGAAELEFFSAADGYYVADLKSAESAVAYPESVVREFYKQHGQQIVEPIRYGSWCGRKDGLSFQDIVIATR